eukprot:scaffold5046_cov403-Prasinococcus_capsulatus_cf.AAC.1
MAWRAAAPAHTQILAGLPSPAGAAWPRPRAPGRCCFKAASAGLARFPSRRIPRWHCTCAKVLRARDCQTRVPCAGSPGVNGPAARPN